MDVPLVSILIPAYNAEAYLAETLDSALAQTWAETEIIVVDDGSRDATIAVALSYEDRDVRVITQQNAGAAAARNRALASASGEFIQFLDADDLLAPDKIAVQMSRLAQEPEGTVASAAWVRFWQDHAGVAFQEHPDWKDFEPARDWLIQSWTGRGTMFPAAWLLPRTVVEAAGPWNETLSLDDDGEYNSRVLTVATKIAFCPDARAYYRSGLDDSLSRRRDPRAMASQREVIRLSNERLLAVEDSARTRHAAACHWQSLSFMAYPDYPEIARDAEAHASALGGGSLRASVSRPLRPVRDRVSWRLAVRLTRAWYRLCHGAR